MSVFLYQTNRMNNSYGDIEELTQVEKIAHTFTVLCEWPTAREQFKLENMYDPKLETHIGDKLWTDQQFSALKGSNNLDATTEDILLIPNLFIKQLDEIEKELQRSAQNHGTSKEHRYQIQFLKQGTFIVLPAYGTRCLKARSIISCFRNSRQ